VIEVKSPNRLKFAPVSDWITFLPVLKAEYTCRYFVNMNDSFLVSLSGFDAEAPYSEKVPVVNRDCEGPRRYRECGSVGAAVIEPGR